MTMDYTKMAVMAIVLMAAIMDIVQCSKYMPPPPPYEPTKQSRIKLNLGLHIPPIVLKLPRMEMPQLVIGANLIKNPKAKPLTINMPPPPTISFGESPPPDPPAPPPMYGYAAAGSSQVENTIDLKAYSSDPIQRQQPPPVPVPVVQPYAPPQPQYYPQPVPVAYAPQPVPARSAPPPAAPAPGKPPMMMVPPPPNAYAQYPGQAQPPQYVAYAAPPAPIAPQYSTESMGQSVAYALPPQQPPQPQYAPIESSGYYYPAAPTAPQPQPQPQYYNPPTMEISTDRKASQSAPTPVTAGSAPSPSPPFQLVKTDDQQKFRLRPSGGETSASSTSNQYMDPAQYSDMSGASEMLSEDLAKEYGAAPRYR